ncbi:MAG: ribonuclease P protein component [Chitinophagales bacterium]|nr:ribonuclease P protein component [Bacteroidota bacterium]
MNTPTATFRPHERLKSRKRIKELFESGKSRAFFPLRCVWLSAETSTPSAPVQVAFSVSKKNFPHATDRNLLKRRMREAYRLQKHLLYPKIAPQQTISLMFLYIAREKANYASIYAQMTKCLHYIIKENNAHAE